jgi:hypothetical protein
MLPIMAVSFFSAYCIVEPWQLWNPSMSQVLTRWAMKINDNRIIMRIRHVSHLKKMRDGLCDAAFLRKVSFATVSQEACKGVNKAEENLVELEMA